jgi:hypothetical protein
MSEYDYLISKAMPNPLKAIRRMKDIRRSGVETKAYQLARGAQRRSAIAAVSPTPKAFVHGPQRGSYTIRRDIQTGRPPGPHSTGWS